MSSSQDHQDNKTNGLPINSVSVRQNYSVDEISQMLDGIDKTLSWYKAKQEGTNPEDMVKTVRGGRVVWITKDEMNEILAKQRKISGKKFIQRTYRGENSLSSEINRRIETCRVLLDILKKTVPDEIAELTRKMRDLDIVHNRSISLARDIHLLETAIQRKKKEIPVVKEMEDATSDMIDALENNQLSEVEICQSFCNQNMDEYNAKHKRLEPYIKKTKSCRMAFRRTKQQLYQLEFDIAQTGKDMLSKQIEGLIYRDKEGKLANDMVSLIQEIQELLTKGYPFFQTLAVYPDEELENHQDLFNKLDSEFLTPLFDKVVGLVETFNKAWDKYVKGNQDTENESTDTHESHSQPESSRMAYPQSQHEKNSL